MPAKRNTANKTTTSELSTNTVLETPASEPVVENKTPEPKAQPMKGGKQTKTPKTDSKVLEKEPVSESLQKGGKTSKTSKDAKLTKAPKAPKAKKSNKKDQLGGEESELDKKIRSFKVKLPQKEDYEGRFTGLTPYQAANKALSKYFRETKEPLTEVSFSIIESTRKSDKHTYSYVGQRYKLETPVVYKIKDAAGESREIVKNYKNLLKKVKKSEQ